MKKTKKPYRPAITKPIPVKLSEPIAWGKDRSIEELTLKVPKAKHMRMLPNEPTTDDLLDLAAKLAGEPTAVIDELSITDTMAVLDAVSRFFPDGQATGSSA